MRNGSRNQEGMSLSIVIPVHNESENIKGGLEGLKSHVSTPHEIVVVLDHCTDNTEEILHSMAPAYPSLRWVKNAGEKGFANTLIEGFRQARGKWVIPFMGDCSDDPETIEKMLALAEGGCDVVCASRYCSGGVKRNSPLVQGSLSRIVNWFLQHALSIPTDDASNAFKLYPRNFLSSIEIEDAGFALSLQLLLKAYFQGLRIGQVPTTWTGRGAGESKFRLMKMAKPYFRWVGWAVWMSLKEGRTS